MRCNLLLGSKFAASLGFEVGHISDIYLNKINENGSLLFIQLDQAAHPWMYKRTVGGFKTIYKNGLTFITGKAKIKIML